MYTKYISNMANKMNTRKLLALTGCIGLGLFSCTGKEAVLEMERPKEEREYNSEMLRAHLEHIKKVKGGEYKYCNRFMSAAIKNLGKAEGYGGLYRSDNFFVRNTAEKYNLPYALVEGQGLYVASNMEAYNEFMSKYCPEAHKNVVIDLLSLHNIYSASQEKVASLDFSQFDIKDFLELCRRVKDLVDKKRSKSKNGQKEQELVTILSAGSGLAIYEAILRICFMHEVLLLCVDLDPKSPCIELNTAKYGVPESNRLMGPVVGDAVSFLGEDSSASMEKIIEILTPYNVLPESSRLGKELDILLARNFLPAASYFEDCEKVFKKVNNSANLVYMSNDLPRCQYEIVKKVNDIERKSGKVVKISNMGEERGAIGFSSAHGWSNKVEGAGSLYFGPIFLGGVRTFEEERNLIFSLQQVSDLSLSEILNEARGTVFIDNTKESV